MVFIEKEDLREILTWLIKRITPEDKKWLRTYFPAAAERIQESLQSSTKVNHTEIILPLSFIKIILDVKANRKPKRQSLSGGVAKKDVRQLARMLKIDFAGKPPLIVLDKVIEEIKKQSYIICPMCKGGKTLLMGGKVVICPKCGGRGKIPKEEDQGPYVNSFGNNRTEAVSKPLFFCLQI